MRLLPSQASQLDPAEPKAKADDFLITADPALPCFHSPAIVQAIEYQQVQRTTNKCKQVPKSVNKDQTVPSRTNGYQKVPSRNGNPIHIIGQTHRVTSHHSAINQLQALPFWVSIFLDSYSPIPQYDRVSSHVCIGFRLIYSFGNHEPIPCPPGGASAVMVQDQSRSFQGLKT